MDSEEGRKKSIKDDTEKEEKQKEKKQKEEKQKEEKHKEEKHKEENNSIEMEINKLNEKADKIIKEIEKKRKRRCFILWSGINSSFVDSVFEDLREHFADLDGELDVIVNSSGGDIDAAYNIACLFQKYGNKKLTFIVPRWAKSAATLLVCSGDEILMTPVAELGPLDPQITTVNPFEDRFEHFSPLHIQTTLDLIRDEFAQGNQDLANGLLKRLQFPLTLGRYIKYHEIGEQYLIRLLKERMEKTGKLKATPEVIAKRLTTEYADHGFCINVSESKKIGLNVTVLEGELLDVIWKLHKIYIWRSELINIKRKAKISEELKNIPPGILDLLRPELLNSEEKKVKK